MRRYFNLLVIFSVAALVLAAPTVEKGDVKLARLQHLRPPDPIDPSTRSVSGILAKIYWDPELMQKKNNEIEPASEIAPPGHCCWRCRERQSQGCNAISQPSNTCTNKASK